MGLLPADLVFLKPNRRELFPGTFRDDNCGTSWTVDDEVLIGEIDAARSRGLKVMLKPHVWTLPTTGIGHRGDIEFTPGWVEAYKTFILHYADIAEQTGWSCYALVWNWRPRPNRNTKMNGETL